MAKISYPEEGLERCAKGHADNCIDKMQAAMNDCNMYVPPEFPYKDWLWGLHDSLSKYRKRYETIREKIASLDSRMRTLEDESLQRIGTIEVKQITEQERLIID